MIIKVLFKCHIIHLIASQFILQQNEHPFLLICLSMCICCQPLWLVQSSKFASMACWQIIDGSCTIHVTRFNYAFQIVVASLGNLKSGPLHISLFSFCILDEITNRNVCVRFYAMICLLSVCLSVSVQNRTKGVWEHSWYLFFFSISFYFIPFHIFLLCSALFWNSIIWTHCFALLLPLHTNMNIFRLLLLVLLFVIHVKVRIALTHALCRHFVL